MSYDPAQTKALLEAIRAKKLDCIEPLLAAGANPNGAPGVETPLQLLSGMQCVLCALEPECPLPGRPLPGNLVYEEPLTAAIRLLASAGADVDREERWVGTPLLRAIRAVSYQAERVPAVDTLIEAGANPNRRDHSGHTPLMASLGENLVSIRHLLAAGADPHLRGPNGWLPAMMARRAGRTEVEALLRVPVSHDEEMTADLFRAIDTYDFSSLKALLEADAPVNARDAQGETLLSSAAHKVFYPAVTLLLKHGADPGPPRPDGLIEDVEKMGIQ